MSQSSLDFIVIGGGVVGLATALAIQNQLKKTVRVLEAEDALARHQTGNNSGVIHAGLYYKPGSLKAKNCAIGREEMYRFCETHDIPHDRCGKVVVAKHEGELPALEELERRGIANGLTGLVRLTPEEIREREPAIRGVAGLFVPQTGIVDYVRVSERYAELIREGGGDIQTRAKVTRVVRAPAELVIETTRQTYYARHLINCGGLQCDRIARMCGDDPGLRIVPFRGEYYELARDRRHLVKNLVYPVPDPRFPFLGVHFTRMIHGGVEAGPNAVLAFRREGYSQFSFSWRDTFDTLTYGGFWKMMSKHWRMGIGEFHRSLSKRAFVDALRQLLPELRMQDVVRAGAGVRAQALEPTGKLVDDFRIVESDRTIHILNAPSPAATASLAIGRSIAETARTHFDL